MLLLSLQRLARTAYQLGEDSTGDAWKAANQSTRHGGSAVPSHPGPCRFGVRFPELLRRERLAVHGIGFRVVAQAQLERIDVERDGQLVHGALEREHSRPLMRSAHRRRRADVGLDDARAHEERRRGIQSARAGVAELHGLRSGTHLFLLVLVADRRSARVLRASDLARRFVTYNPELLEMLQPSLMMALSGQQQDGAVREQVKWTLNDPGPVALARRACGGCRVPSEAHRYHGLIDSGFHAVYRGRSYAAHGHCGPGVRPGPPYR